MSAFAKDTTKRHVFSPLVKDTPGPNQYALNQGLLSNDPNKHFGFIDKSKRFRSPSKNEEHESTTPDENMLPSRSPSPFQKQFRSTTDNKEVVMKLKKEVERCQEALARVEVENEKNSTAMQSKIAHLESSMRTLQQEKQKVTTACAAKEKDVQELKQKERALTLQLDKTLKQFESSKEASAKVNALQKKVDEFEKQRPKGGMEKKLTAENDFLIMKNKDLKAEIEKVKKERTHAETQITAFKKDRKELEASIKNANCQIETLNSEFKAAKEAWEKESSERLDQSCQIAAKLAAEEENFANTIQKLRAEEERAKNELEEHTASFESQRQAYLRRISQLEADLEVVERSLTETTLLQQSTLLKFEKSQKTTKQQIAEIDSLKEKIQELNSLQQDFGSNLNQTENALRAAETQIAELTVEKHLVSKTLEETSKQLGQKIDELQNNLSEAANKRLQEVNAHQTLLSKKDIEISCSYQQLEQLKASLEASQIANEDLKLRNSEVKNGVATLKAANENLTELLNNTKEQLSQTQDEIKIVKHSSEVKLQQLNADVLQRQSQFDSALAERQATISALEAQCQELKQQLMSGTDEWSVNKSDLLSKLAQLQQELTEAENQLDVGAKQIIQLQSKFESEVARSNSEIASLQSELKSEQSRYAELVKTSSDDKKVLEQKIAHLQSTLSADKTNYEATIEKLNSEVIDKEALVFEQTSRISELEQTVTSLNNFQADEKSGWQNERETLEKKVANQAHQIEILNEKLQQFSQDNEKLAHRAQLVDEIKNENALLSDKLASTCTELADKMNLAAEHEKTISVMKDSATDIQNTLTERNNEIEVLNSNYAKISRELAAERQKAKDLEIEGDGLNSSLSEARSALSDVLEKIESLEKTNECQSEALIKDKQKIHALEKEISELKTFNEQKVAELDSLKQQKDDLENNYSSVSENGAVLKSEVGRLNNVLKQREADYNSTVEKLELKSREYEDSAEALARLQQEISAKTSELENVEIALKNEIQKIQNEKEELSRDLEKSQKSLEAQNDNILNLRQENSVIAQSLDCITDELRKEKQIAEGLRQQSSCTEQDLVQARVQLAEKTKAFDETSKSLADVENLLEAQEKSCFSLSQSLESMEVEKTELQQQLEKSLDELSEKCSALDLLEKDCEEKAVSLHNISFQVSTLQDEVSSLNSQLTTSALRVETLESEHSGLLETINKLEASKSAVEKKVDILESTSSKLNKELDNVKAQLDNEKLVSGNLEASLREVEQSSNQKNREYELQISALNQNVSNLEETVKTLTNSIRIGEGVIADKEEAIAHLNNTVLEKDRKAELLKNDYTITLAGLEEEIKSKEGAWANEREVIEKERQLAETQLQMDVKRLTKEVEKVQKTLVDITAKNAAQTETIEFMTSERERLEKQLQQLKSGAETTEQIKKQSLQLQLRLERDSAHFEKTIQEMSMKVAEKTQAAKRLDIELRDTQNKLSMIEVQYANELSETNLSFKNVKLELREKTKHCEALELKLKEMSDGSSNHNKSKKELEHTNSVLHETKERLKEMERALLDEKNKFERRIRELETTAEKNGERGDQFKALYEDSERTKKEMEESFASSLELLKRRGALNDEETKKIAELNADLFGHVNNRQKIKHLAQIKEENIELKKKNLQIERKRDDLKKKLFSVERELEAYKSVGGGGRKFAPRTRVFSSTQANSTFNIADASSQSILMKEDMDLEDISVIEKENRGTGGVSFMISP